MALEIRNGICLAELIHHSDRGSQYSSTVYTSILKNRHIVISMSRKGNPYDNAFAERLFKTIKYETLYYHETKSFEELLGLIKYCIADYNADRLHSAIGYQSPNEFKMRIKSQQLKEEVAYSKNTSLQ